MSSSELDDGYGETEDGEKPDFCMYGLVLFDVATGRQIARQSAYEGAFSRMSWSPDSREFAGITQDGWVFIFDGSSGKLRLKFRAHQLFGDQIAWSPDGKTLETATNPRLTLTPRFLKFDFKSGAGFSASGNTQAWDGKKKLVLTEDARGETKWNGRTERSMKQFDARTGKQIGETIPLETGAADLAFSPDGKQLALGEREFALVLNAQTLAVERRLQIPAKLRTSPTLAPSPTCVSWSQDSATLALSTAKGLNLWRMR